MLDMTPTLVANYVINVRPTYGVSSRQIRSRIALRKALANQAHLIFVKFMVWVQFAGSTWRKVSTLCHHIGMVVLQCTKKQMRWIDARRIVTVMADEHTFWNGAMVKLPRETMDKSTLVGPEHAISLVVRAAIPQPALFFAATFNLLPEAVKSRFPLQSRMVTMDEMNRLPLDPTALRASLLGDGCKVAATTMAITVGNIVRGIMGMHKKFTFLVPSLGTIPVVAGAIRVRFTPSIIPQKEAYR